MEKKNRGKSIEWHSFYPTVINKDFLGKNCILYAQHPSKGILSGQVIWDETNSKPRVIFVTNKKTLATVLHYH